MQELHQNWTLTWYFQFFVIYVIIFDLGGPLDESTGIEDTASDVLLRKFLDSSVEPVITEIRFPQYKSLTPGLKITFSYPITALVGANGTNKSSILHAIQAAPEGRSVGDFWFSTAVDEIQEPRLSVTDRHRFIYKYRTHVGKKEILPECRKSRVTRNYRTKVPKALEGNRDPDSWEPTKVSTRGDKMLPIPSLGGPADSLLHDSRKRWKLIEKNVVYLDFRSELSAFDKFFYHSPFTHWAPNRAWKKLKLIEQSQGLARAFDGTKLRKIDEKKLIESRKLSTDAVKAVSAILGKNFTSIQLLRHSYYASSGYSARMKLAGRTYSEAHAGSGEFAIVRLVDEVVSALPNSLIVLDEPEVSLHPGAQRHLIRFLKRECLIHGHQVVMSTHSPTIISELPPPAVKLLGTRTGEGDVELLSDSTAPGEAFFHLGHFTGGSDQKIVVEDDLAAEIVTRAIRVFHQEYLDVVKPSVFPGGGDRILKNLLPTQALVASNNVTLLLDGDKAQWDADWRFESKLIGAGGDSLDWISLLARNLGVNTELFPDGSNGKANAMSKIENAKTVAVWARLELFHLRGLSPESALLFEMRGVQDGNGPFIDTVSAKREFVTQTKKFHGKLDRENVTAEEILGYQKHVIAKLGSGSGLLRSANVAVERAISKL